MLRAFYLLTLATLLQATGASAETYKCRAPDGKITYSGQLSTTPGIKCDVMFVRKPTVNQEIADVPTGSAAVPPGNTDIKPVEKSAADKELEAKRKKIESEDARKKTGNGTDSLSAEQKIKEENCEIAKSNLKTYQYGDRITKVDEKGEKAYLDEAEIKQKTEQAQKEVDKWCAN